MKKFETRVDGNCAEMENRGPVVKVEYNGGESRHSTEIIDYMLADVDGTELYAELRNPTWMVERNGEVYKEEDWEELLKEMGYQEEEEAKRDAEWYLDDETATYDELKTEILRQAANEGIPKERLKFWYD